MCIADRRKRYLEVVVPLKFLYVANPRVLEKQDITNAFIDGMPFREK